VTLHLKPGAKAARFEYTDGSMEVSWTVDASLADDELVERLRSIVAFMDAQTGKEPLPQRIPGMALGMAQTAHPPMQEAAPAVGNGWAAMAAPELPDRLKGEVEMIPPEERE
jgi:hypothetical protein